MFGKDIDKSIYIKCTDNHINTVRALIESQAKINIEDNIGKTVLDYAIENGNKTIIALLNKAGAKRGKGKKKELTPLRNNASELNYEKIENAFELISKGDAFLRDDKTVKGNRFKTQGFALLQDEFRNGKVLSFAKNANNYFYTVPGIYGEPDEIQLSTFDERFNIKLKFVVLRKNDVISNGTSDAIYEKYEEVKWFNVRCYYIDIQNEKQREDSRRKPFWGKIEIIRPYGSNIFYDQSTPETWAIKVYCRLHEVYPINLTKIPHGGALCQQS